MTTPSWFERQQAALSRLVELVGHRAATERRLAEEHEAVVSDNDKQMGKLRKAVAAEQAEFHAEEDELHEKNLLAIRDKAEQSATQADEKRFDVRKRTVDQYSAALEKNRTKLSEKLWTLDSILEANEKEAKDRLAERGRVVSNARKRLDELAGQSVPRMATVQLAPPSMGTADESDPLPGSDPSSALSEALSKADHAVTRLVKMPVAGLIGVKGAGGLAVAGTVVGAGVGFGLTEMPLAAILTMSGLVGGLFAWGVGSLVIRTTIRNRAALANEALAAAARQMHLLDRYAKQTHEQEQAKILENHKQAQDETNGKYGPRITTLEENLAGTLREIDTKYAAHCEKIRDTEETETEAENRRHAQLVEKRNQEWNGRIQAAEDEAAAKLAQATAKRDQQFAELERNWFDTLTALRSELNTLTAECRQRAPDWADLDPEAFALPDDPAPGIPFGQYAVDQYALPDGMPFDSRLNPQEPIDCVMPAFVPFPKRSAIMVKAGGPSRQQAIALIQDVMLRFLTGLPPGKVRFTIIDPVGLGENFAGFMHLTDFDDKLVGSRIWTEAQQIDQRLTDLTEHMENVIQKYLRNQYSSIEDYNQAAGEVAEPYRVLVIANFPHNFTTDSARRLVSIMTSGPACGVCTLVTTDQAGPFPREFNPADLEEASFTFEMIDGKPIARDTLFHHFPFIPERPPEPKLAGELIRKVGQASLTAARVEVPFEFIMPKPEEIWAGSTRSGLDLAIGRAGATRRQRFTLGKGTAQHALVAGKTGSGKSTLLHAMIVNMALTYPPDEAELYLIDFKKGVEFQAYSRSRLPHARVIAIESEREFGLSVLQRLDGILKERGEEFRRAGVNDLAGYREAKPEVSCPRILLIVDEFQEFFVDDDKLAQEAAQLLDRLVRQGRAFGVHILLGSQTLGGAYSLARSTIDQMAVRIALQCSEADAQLILSKDNTAARLLNRPGEAIYNDANGLMEGNDPFQVVWLDDDKRETLLTEIRQRAEASGKLTSPPILFEGNSSADLAGNSELQGWLNAAEPYAGPPRLLLGEPVAIKEPTALSIRSQSAANVLMLGQHEEAAVGLMAASLVSLALSLRGKQPNWAEALTVLDGTPEDSDFFGFILNTATSLGLESSLASMEAMPSRLESIAATLAQRQSGESSDRSPRILLVHGLHRFRELRKPEDDFGFGRKSDKPASPGELFINIVREGPSVGIHTVLWCDSLTNFQRALDRSGLREFVYRVLFQMSAADSSHLLDTPVASRLGANRALFAEEGAEKPEKFRPYGIPPGSWLRTVGEKLSSS